MAASWPSCSVRASCPCILPDCVCSLLSNVLLYVAEQGKMKVKKCLESYFDLFFGLGSFGCAAALSKSFYSVMETWQA
jgi:hypothetical protein